MKHLQECLTDLVRTSHSDSIEFFKGETMDETDMSNLLISYSTDIVNNYEPEYAPWDQLHHLVSADDYHYAAHHFQDKYRTSDKAILHLSKLRCC